MKDQSEKKKKKYRSPAEVDALFVKLMGTLDRIEVLLREVKNDIQEPKP